MLRVRTRVHRTAIDDPYRVLNSDTSKDGLILCSLYGPDLHGCTHHVTQTKILYCNKVYTAQFCLQILRIYSSVDTNRLHE